MSQTRDRRSARALGVILAAILAISPSAGLVTALATDADEATRAQPIAIPVDQTTCAGESAGLPWPQDRSTISIPIGKECPHAATWLRWDDGHGGEVGQDAGVLVDWILDPEQRDLAEPSWQRVLPGRSVARLRDAEDAMNSLAGEVIYLPMFDATRGAGERSEVHVVAVLPFRLHRAYLASGDPACGTDDPTETCLVGSFLEAPPRPSPTRTPTPSRTPSPAPSGPPMPSGSPVPSPSGSPDPSASGSPSPSASGTPEPSASPTSNPSPTSTLPPGSVLGLDVPGAVAIPLLRGEANRVEILAQITGDVPWSVCVEDTAIGKDRGHMVSTGSADALERPMSAGVASQSLTALDQPTCISLQTAADDALVVVVLEQEVGPSDRPGTYRMGLIFRVVTGF